MEAASIKAAIRAAGDSILGGNRTVGEDEARDAMFAESAQLGDLGDVIDVAERLVSLFAIAKQVERDA